jgi:Pectate lyase superfamily protein
MAFPQTVETLAMGTDLVTLVSAASEWNPPRVLLNKIQALVVGPIWVNAIAKGADPTGAADSSAAIQAAITDLGNAGGVVYVPPGLYRMDTLVKVPSLVTIQGAGMYTTKFFAPAASADIFMFEVATTATQTMTNVYSQVFGVQFKDFEIRDRASSDTLKLQTSGRSEDHHGILIHDSDWSIIQNVNFRDLQGRALHFSNVAREWYCANIYVQNCGDSAESMPAVDINSASGDATNTLYFYGLRVLFSTYIGVNITGTQDGIRLINFTDCQFEGGGNGSAGTYGNPWPYDIMSIGRINDVSFNNCEWSNPGSGKWCINVVGYDGTSQFPFRVDINGGRFNGNSQGGGIRCNRFTSLGVTQTWWQGSTVATGDYYLETTCGAIIADLGNVPSANPTAGPGVGKFRGKETTALFQMNDMRLNMPGGGVTSHVAGKPTDNMGLGAAAPNGMHKIYDITNFLWWDREFRTGIGDLWVVEPGQTAYRANDVTFNDASEHDYLSYTIPAGTLGYGAGIEVEMFGFFSGTGVGTATLRIKVGGTTCFQDVSVALVNGVQLWRVRFILRTHATDFTECRCVGDVMINAISAATTGEGDIAVDEITCNSLVGFTNSALDFSTSKALAVSWQHSATKSTTMWAGQVRYC